MAELGLVRTQREQLLQDFYAALDDGDWDGVLASVSDDVLWRVQSNGTTPEVTFTSRAQLAAWFHGGPHQHRTEHHLRHMVCDGPTAAVIADVDIAYAGRCMSARAADVVCFDGALIAQWTRVFCD